ncbi:MAG: anaerobic ribonucleoside-triphosphate reductase activating protein [Thermoprotei archaeon]|nr:MAG: anaerobic ribonucleoside-triphosphate reductase activating protein [Thermoprotei archaeon]
MNSGVEVELSVVEERLRKALLLVDALHITGGECTLQPKGLEALCSLAKRLSMDVAVNTNGSRPEVVEALIERRLVDYVAMDVKAPLEPAAYSKLIGVDARAVIDKVKRTLELCSSRNVTLEVRTTVVPGLIGEDEVAAIARSVEGCNLYVLNQFVPSETVLSPELRKAPATPRDFLVKLARIAIGEGLREVYIRTRERGFERID